VNEKSVHASKSPGRTGLVVSSERDAIVCSFQTKNTIQQGDYSMKRFFAVLIASMFLASAAYAADAVKEEKADAKTEAKGEKSKCEKGKGDEKKTEGKAKAAETKSDKAGATAEEKKTK
jgi:hypothetical protein